MRNFLLIILFSMGPFAKAVVNETTATLHLQEIEIQALSSSYQSKALDAELAAAKNKTDVVNGSLYPKLVLDASYKYINEVPSLDLPGGVKSAFGDNHNYSIGPILSWTLWDSGSIQKTLTSARALESSKEFEKKLTKKNLLLNTRIAYFKVQLKQEQLRLVTDSLKLAESQYKDIQNRVEAGASTRIDLLSAHKQVLNLKIESRQLQSDLSNEIRDLFAIAGLAQKVEFSKSIVVDSISNSLKKFSQYDNKTLAMSDLDQHPLIRVYNSNAESMRATSESFLSKRYPKITMFAKTSIEYPNGPILERFHQNTIGINVTLPIFDSGLSRAESSEKMNMALAIENRREQSRIDLYRDWEKSQDQLQGLKDKIAIYKKAVTESEEQARLVYSSYRFGRSSFLEVQTSNLHALELKVHSTANDIQILMQLAYLASISEE